MSLDPPNQTRNNQPTANGALTGLPSDEPALVTLFSELTGESESQARSTFMFVSREDKESNTRRPD
jgi:hypothetical protein